MAINPIGLGKSAPNAAQTTVSPIDTETKNIQNQIVDTKVNAKTNYVIRDEIYAKSITEKDINLILAHKCIEGPFS